LTLGYRGGEKGRVDKEAFISASEGGVDEEERNRYTKGL